MKEKIRNMEAAKRSDKKRIEELEGEMKGLKFAVNVYEKTCHKCMALIETCFPKNWMFPIQLN